MTIISSKYRASCYSPSSSNSNSLQTLNLNSIRVSSHTCRSWWSLLKIKLQQHLNKQTITDFDFIFQRNVCNIITIIIIISSSSYWERRGGCCFCTRRHEHFVLVTLWIFINNWISRENFCRNTLHWWCYRCLKWQWSVRVSVVGSLGGPWKP